MFPTRHTLACFPVSRGKGRVKTGNSPIHGPNFHCFQGEISQNFSGMSIFSHFQCQISQNLLILPYLSHLHHGTLPRVGISAGLGRWNPHPAHTRVVIPPELKNAQDTEICGLVWRQVQFIFFDKIVLTFLNLFSFFFRNSVSENFFRLPDPSLLPMYCHIMNQQN